MRYLLRCQSCGYSKEVDTIRFVTCPNCEDRLIVNNIEEDGKIAEELERKEQEIRKQFNKEDIIITRGLIKKLGQKSVWNSIEKITNPYRRVEERQIYFEAVKELKKER